MATQHPIAIENHVRSGHAAAAFAIAARGVVPAVPATLAAAFAVSRSNVAVVVVAVPARAPGPSHAV